MLKNAARTGMEVADDVIQGRKFIDSVKNRVPAGIKRGIEDIAFQSAPPQRDEQERSRKDHDEDIVVTFSHNGLRSRAVLRMHKVGVGSVFGAAYTD